MSFELDTCKKAKNEVNKNLPGVRKPNRTEAVQNQKHYQKV